MRGEMQKYFYNTDLKKDEDEVRNRKRLEKQAKKENRKKKRIDKK